MLENDLDVFAPSQYRTKFSRIFSPLRGIICLFALSLACLSTASFAQSVPVSLKPYADQYQAAVKSRDRVAIADAARDLWQATEDLLGDDARTGDMAYLYARRAARLPPSPRSERDARKAFKRSIELARLSEDKAFDTEMKRRLDWIEAEVNGVHLQPSRRTLDDLRDRLEAWTSTDTVYHADFRAIEARYAFFVKGDALASVQAAGAARTAYLALKKTGTQRALKNYELLMRAMSATGESLIDQALMAQEYAGVVLDTSGSKQRKTEAITLYRKADQMLGDEDQIATAVKAGFERPSIIALLEQADLKVLKVHPMMPAKAVRSGHADVEIMVLPDGRVGDVKIISESDDMFGVAAVEAVRKWHFNPKHIDQDGGPIVERIEFTLYGTHGERR